MNLDRNFVAIYSKSPIFLSYNLIKIHKNCTKGLFRSISDNEYQDSGGAT